jgi:hypothetical protein
MRVLAFLTVAGLVLLALLFLADASQAVLDAQPKPDHEALTRIEPAARAARAEAPPKTRRDAPQASIENQRNQFQQTDLVDRFSNRGQ